jgi:Bacterial Ig-like domain (group 1)
LFTKSDLQRAQMKLLNPLVMSVLVAAAVAGHLPLGAAAQGPPPSLDGENLQGGSTELGPVGGMMITAESCNPAGNSSFSFTATGVAVGPYPGTFTESGTVSLGPETQLYGGGPTLGGPMTAFSAQFTITSATATVTGTKRFNGSTDPAPFFPGQAVCHDPAAGSEFDVPITQGTYVATIQTASGATTDQGTTGVVASGPSSNPANARGFFFENFVSSQPVVGSPATVTLSPTAATNAVGTSHTVIATVTDATGQPVPDTVVQFTVAGGANTAGSCTTAANGQCAFTYQGPVLPGQDVITGCAGPDGTAPCGTATKTWLLPTSTPGCRVTNGGWIIAPDGGKGHFAGNARIAKDGTLRGQERYMDRGIANIDVRSIEVLAIVCKNNMGLADIYGRATVNGTGSHYFRIEVTDPDSARGSDTYGITLDTGYTTGDQPVRAGKVEIAP